MSIQPLSSAPLSALMWDIDSGTATTLFGDSPYNVISTPPPSSGTFGKLLASVFDHLRQNIWPAIMDSANMTKIQVVFKSQTADVDDVLNVTTVETSLDVYGTVTGPSAKTIERGLVVAPEFECLIAARHLTGVPTAKADGIRVGGVSYDVIGVLPCPNVPDPIGYRFFLRRAV